MSDPVVSNELPATRTSLLKALRHDVQTQRLIALGIFYERYRHGLARLLVSRFGIDRHDADEILHEFLVEKMVDASFIESYLDCHRRSDTGHRLFRPYLARSLCNFTIDRLRRKKVMVVEDAQLEASLGAEYADLYTLQWAQDILTTTFQRLRCHYIEKDSERYWSLFVCRWIEPLVTGHQPPSYEQLAVKYSFDNAKQVGNALTNVLRMFKQKWHEVLQDDIGTQDDQALSEAIRDARMSVRMARYIDFSQLLNQVMRRQQDGSKRTDCASYQADESTYQGFLDLATDGFDRLLPIEQSLLFESYLRMPLGTCFPADGTIDRDPDLAVSDFSTVLADPSPNVGHLQLLAKRLQRSIRTNSLLIPANIAGVIRFAVIALADLRCKQSITRMTTHELVDAMSKIADERWIDEVCRSLIQDFLDHHTVSSDASSSSVVDITDRA